MFKTSDLRDKIFEIVERMQPVTVLEVCLALKKYGIQISEQETLEHMERLRSSFPKKLARAGPDRFCMIYLR